MILREYQKNAVIAVLRALHNTSKNPCVVLPTGSGKTAVITTLVQWLTEKERARVLVLSHRKELIEQTAATLERRYNTAAAIYSAGIGVKDVNGAVVIGSIQSVASDLEQFTASAPFTHLVIDEAHLIPNLEDNTSQYQQLIKALKVNYPSLRVIGFTATPYRLDSGLLCSDNATLNYNCYEVKTRDLIEQGFLSPLVTSSIEDNITQDTEQASSKEDTLNKAIENILKATASRNKVILFCSSVAHALLVADKLKRKTSERVEVISGNTPKEDRERIIELFKNDNATNLIGESVNALKYLVNVDILTTGFDAPNIDAVVLLRATQSRALYVQMIGRGLRLYPNKKNCLVLDFANNIKRFGELDNYCISSGVKVKAKEDKERYKKCLKCGGLVPLKDSYCSCGYAFDKIECPYCKKLTLLALSHCESCGKLLIAIPHKSAYDTSGALVLTDKELEKSVKPIKDKVVSVRYEYAYSRSSGAPMLMEKLVTELGERVNLFIMFESSKLYPREKARKWWRARTNAPLPQSCLQAYYYAIADKLAKPSYISYRPKKQGDRYIKVLREYIEADLSAPEELNTDNPLNLVCNKCKSGIISYITRGGSFKAVCARCNTTIKEYNEQEARSIEQRYKLKFLTPNPKLF